jgi:hypothetical protein
LAELFNKKIKRMNKIYFMKNPVDQVRVCNGNTCIEARGDNARILVCAFAFMLVCVGIAALASK